MSVAITLATMRRILGQLRHDHRTIGLLVGVPSLLMILLRYVFDTPGAFDRIGPMLLGLFPFVVMFIVTSVGTLRERTSGTLERLMTMPLAKLDVLAGYGIAFALMATLQATLVCAYAITVLDLELDRPWVVVLLRSRTRSWGWRSASSRARSRAPSSRPCSSCPPSFSRRSCSAACSSRARA